MFLFFCFIRLAKLYWNQTEITKGVTDFIYSLFFFEEFYTNHAIIVTLKKTKKGKVWLHSVEVQSLTFNKFHTVSPATRFPKIRLDVHLMLNYQTTKLPSTSKLCECRKMTLKPNTLFHTAVPHFWMRLSATNKKLTEQPSMDFLTALVLLVCAASDFFFFFIHLVASRREIYRPKAFTAHRCCTSGIAALSVNPLCQ